MTLQTMNKLFRFSLFFPGTFFAGALIIGLLFHRSTFPCAAAELNCEITLSQDAAQKRDTKALRDKKHSSSLTLPGGSTVTVQVEDGDRISGLYIIWDSPAKPWTLTTDSGSVNCGKHGFLHEYVALDAPTSTAVIHIPEDGMRISDIRVFDGDTPPGDVQIWNPPVDEADIMLVAAHADDEILFLGGIIPTYAVMQNADIQVVYMSEFWSSARIREHEKLDGLWAAGLRNYPVCGGFKDVYSASLQEAEKQYSFDDMTEYLTGEIRRFRPQVIVTHDQNGEYGHGFHMLTSKAVTTAVELATDTDACADSAECYGIWDTPKTYLHLYGENKIRLDLRIPIDAMDGRSALEVAADAYKQHVSQQWCWFYVSDDYKYSCADFGLFRTTVGYDTGNDMLENIALYHIQAEEARRIAAIHESMEAENAKAKKCLREMHTSVLSVWKKTVENL